MQGWVRHTGDMAEDGPLGWEISRIRKSGQVSIATTIHRQIQRGVICTAAQICKVQQVGAGVIELSNKSISVTDAALEDRLKRGAGNRKLEPSRHSLAGNIYGTGGIDLDRQTGFTSVAAKKSRVTKNRIDNQRNTPVIPSDIKANCPVIHQPVSARNVMTHAADDLIKSRTAQVQFVFTFRADTGWW